LALFATKQRRLITGLTLAAVAMFGFGYALVPLYDVLCSTLGINGKTGGPTTAIQKNHIDKSRTVLVQFVANNAANLPWEFKPNTRSLEMHPGEMKRVSYFAENDSNRKMTIQAIPSVTPGLAARYLKKTECFCFNQQTLKSHESMDMPLLFHLDPAIPKSIHTVTLSYTLFDVSHMKLKQNKNSGKIS
jgi:cytochrome c oxidase assembly protein subunit 11